MNERNNSSRDEYPSGRPLSTADKWMGILFVVLMVAALIAAGVWAFLQ